ncbi:hypothetical protein [Streptomyces sp. NBC_00140]|uniref:hypothetical protein n=1 Tax=Streptomyces sp. NBC_00140 TaxID=2975664 RepID=UPI0022583162|nr:hypothetical protein [Streptomyces sp. NBC_00140]MCX5338288.1 hypothetical protein [Streptomyces sp. NBC_00140]
MSAPERYATAENLNRFDVEQQLRRAVKTERAGADGIPDVTYPEAIELINERLFYRRTLTTTDQNQNQDQDQTTVVVVVVEEEQLESAP